MRRSAGSFRLRLRFSIPIALVALSGCDGGTSGVFIEQPWPPDHLAVVLITDADGSPVAPVAVVAPGAPAGQWSLPEGSTQVHVRTWAPSVRAPDGRTLLECGPRLGGAGPAMPSPTTSWATPVFSPEGGGAVVLAPETSIRAFDLRLSGCERPDPTCPGYVARSLAVPADFRPHRIVHLGTHALVESPARTATDAVQLARVTPTQVELLPEDPRIGRLGGVRSLTYDPTPPERVMMVFSDGRVATLDRDGRYTSEFQVPVPADNFTEFEFDTGVDGESLYLTNDGLFRLPAGATSPIDMTDTIPAGNAPDRIAEVFVHTFDRRMLRLDKDIYTWTDAGWQVIFRGDLFDSFSHMDADDDYRGVVGDLEIVYAEGASSGRWLKLERPFDLGHRLRGVDGLGNGRFVVVGERATVAVWNGAQWCQARHDGPEGTTLTHVATAGGAEGYAIGGNEDDQPSLVVYIDVPDA